MFNGNVKTLAMAVVCPLDAEDVSRYVKDNDTELLHIPLINQQGDSVLL